jgi:hypothetical protein
MAAATWTPPWKRVLRRPDRVGGGWGYAREASVRLDVDGRVQQERQVRRGGLSGFSADAERKRGRRWGPTQHVVKEMEEGGGVQCGQSRHGGEG